MNNEQKHILFLPRWYPHQFDPMFGLFIKKHAEAVSLYNQVSVLYIQGINSKEDFKKKQTFESPNLFTQIYYYRISANKLWNVVRFWFYLIIGYLLIQKKKGKPDLVHVHILTRLGIFALILKWIYKTPYIITEHWSRYLPETNSYKGWLRKKLGKIVVRKAKAILPVSKALADAMKNHGLLNMNYQIIPNVVEDIFYEPLNKSAKNHPIVFLHVSTFEDRSKNISGILRVIKQLSETRLDFEFWFVGDGIDFEAMKNYSMTLKIPTEVIRFYGIRQGKDLANIYHQADYLVMFSNYETFLVVINEAQACGLPVVCTRVGELSQLINETNGFLIEPRNEKQLESTLNNILINKPSFNASEIQKKAKKEYRYDAVSQRLNTIYRS